MQVQTMQEENKAKLVSIDEAAAALDARREIDRLRLWSCGQGNGGSSRFTCATTGESSAADSGYRSVWSCWL
jgi:hypothetical protein